MSRTELATLAAETRLAQLDLNAARRAHQAGQATDREVEMSEASRDSALDFYEEAEALADEATPMFAPRPWLADGAYVPTESRDEADQAFAAEAPAPRFSLLLSFIRGEEPGSTTFDSQAAAETYVRQELRDLSSIWRVRVLDPAGQVVRLAVRSGYNATGRSWIWATPIS